MSEEANEASLIFVSVKEGEEREGREKKRKKCIGLKYKTPTKFKKTVRTLFFLIRETGVRGRPYSQWIR